MGMFELNEQFSQAYIFSNSIKGLSSIAEMIKHGHLNA